MKIYKCKNIFESIISELGNKVAELNKIEEDI
jgi:hypothetical protein